MSSYVPPPPPAPPAGRGGDSCFKWGGIACGGGCLLILLACVGIYFMLGDKGRSFLVGTTRDSVQVSVEIHELFKQVNRYKKDTGKFPDKLQDLVPGYVASPSRLKLSTHPEGPPFKYFKPGPNAKPEDVLLEYDINVKTPDDKSVEVPVMMQIDGRTRQGTSRIIPPGKGSTGPPGGIP